MIKAIIFDFDGLILDTETPAFQAWQEIYEEYGCDIPVEKWALVLGGSGAEFDPLAYLEAKVGLPIDRDSLYARRRDRKAELAAKEDLLTRQFPLDHADLRVESLADLTLEALTKDMHNRQEAL
jgi:beta-phosphoglucomutase-like phosphatase (HAD superfamily)